MTTRKNQAPSVHPLIEDLSDQLRRGQCDRREFLRTSTLLGLSSAAAYAMAGRLTGETVIESAKAQTPKSGGILRVGMQVQKMEDPATYAWGEMANQTRHIAEYLTITGTDNVTRPLLAESWQASDDLKTWTFTLREGVKWHNGEELTADHVVWNVKRWLDPDLGSPNAGLSTFSAMLEDQDGTNRMVEGAVEAVDARTVRFNLNQPVLSVPEDCYNYPAHILHPSFQPPFSDNPLGTGPYQLLQLDVGERCILKRVTETTDGQPFTYWGGEVFLDEIHYYNFDVENQLTAFASGEVDAIDEFGIEQYALAEALDGAILQARSAQTVCCRMQVSQPPFDNLKLRQAIQKATDHTVFKELIFQGNGDVGWDHCVAPVHPAYYELPPLQRDVEAARALLTEAGYPDGIELTIDVGNTNGPWHQTLAELLKDQLKDAGITLNINVMPPSKYWEIWDKTPFGATAWTHRPLGNMVLSLAFRKGAQWNESHYASDEFDQALNDVESTLNIEDRRAKMETVERILQEAAVMIQPVFRPQFTIVADKVRNYPAHPTRYHQYNQTWLDS